MTAIIVGFPCLTVVIGMWLGFRHEIRKLDAQSRATMTDREHRAILTDGKPRDL